MDTTVVIWLNDLAQHPVLRQVAEAGAKFVVALPVVIVGYLVLRSVWRRDGAALASLLVAGAGTAIALGVNVIATTAWFRPRPYTALSQIHALVTPTTESSFFSDHTVVVTGCAIAALLVSRRWGLVATAAALAVAVARVAVGAHYPSDVAAAAMITAAVISALLPIRSRLSPHTQRLVARVPERFTATRGEAIVAPEVAAPDSGRSPLI